MTGIAKTPEPPYYAVIFASERTFSSPRSTAQRENRMVSKVFA
ncbi:hypothetical protein [Priestia megaterium]|nr:hypothetical protein [Priestia megaterium]